MAEVDQMDYETAVAELERTVQLLGKEQDDLAESVRTFERGLALARRCAQLLDDAERAAAKQFLVEEDGTFRFRHELVREALAASATAGRAAGPHGLTQRELEVVRLVREGCTNQQIAESLFVSVRTVETHLSHVFAKLGATSRTGLLKALSEER